MLVATVLVLLSAILMEPIAWLSHKHLMHGAGWAWHKSHHQPRTGIFEANDFFAIGYAAIAIALIWLGTRGLWPLQWIGTGMTLYGVLYAIAHDGLVHRRWPIPIGKHRGYIKRLVQAHRLHHAVNEKSGAVSFAFLWAPSPHRLRRELQASRRNASGAVTDGRMQP